MKQLFVTIEHRKFTLNVQDEYYDEIIQFFSIKNELDLSSSNSLSSILSMLMKTAIESIDINKEVLECIEKVDNFQTIDNNNNIQKESNNEAE